jgi:hypothetical protein
MGCGGLDPNGVAGRIGGIEADDNFFVIAGREGQAGVVGGDGQAAAAAVGEDGEFDFGRAAVVEEFIERGLGGATGEQHIVHQDDGGAVDIGGNVRGRKFLRDGIAADIVAMEGDIEHTADGVRARGKGRSSFAPFDKPRASEDKEANGEPAGQLDAAVGDAEEQEFLSGGVAGGNGGGQAVESGLDLAGAEGLGFCHETLPWRKSAGN